MTSEPATLARQTVLPLTAIALAALIHALWGANAVAIKLGLEAVPALWSAFIRFAIGLVCVAIWARVTGLRAWPAPHEWRPLVILSTLFIVQIVCMYWGFGLTSGIMGTILLTSFPLWAVLFGDWILPDERLGPYQLAGIAVSFAGTVLVLARNTDFGQLSLADLGNLIIIVAAALLGLRIAYAGRIVRSIDPVRITIWMMVLSLPVFALGAALTETIAWHSLGWRPLLALLYQGVVIAGFCFTVNYWLMRRYNPAVVASFGFLEPISGVLASAWLLGETLSWPIAAGAGAVGLGLLLLTRKGRAERRTTP